MRPLNIIAVCLVIGVTSLAAVEPASADIIPKTARLAFHQEPYVIRTDAGVDARYTFDINVKRGQCVTFKKMVLIKPRDAGRVIAPGFPVQICDTNIGEHADGSRNGGASGAGWYHFGPRSRPGKWSAVLIYSIEGRKNHRVPDGFTLRNRYW